MPPHEPTALLNDALEQIDDLRAKAATRSLAELLSDRDLQAIFERRFEILGEALRRLERSAPLAFARIAGGPHASPCATSSRTATTASTTASSGIR